MPHRSLLVLFVAAIATLNVLTGAAQGQTPAPPPLTYERVITTTWKNLHDRILADGQGHGVPRRQAGMEAASRFAIGARGIPPGHDWPRVELGTAARREVRLRSAREKADAGKPKTRASIVSEMEAAIAISYPLVEKSPKPLLIGWIRDQAEHYGKLVSNYRAVGIVPPISRKPASQ